MAAPPITAADALGMALNASDELRRRAVELCYLWNLEPYEMVHNRFIGITVPRWNLQAAHLILAGAA